MGSGYMRERGPILIRRPVRFYSENGIDDAGGRVIMILRGAPLAARKASADDGFRGFLFSNRNDRDSLLFL